ncbi:MAG: hypothetical protein EKK54_04390 [Neisseriaceae bacterium]|nr:MAG: hypothetical protein EKK54_04390 [Neisseriaceae bacterium]
MSKNKKSVKICKHCDNQMEAIYKLGRKRCCYFCKFAAVLSIINEMDVIQKKSGNNSNSH